MAHNPRLVPRRSTPSGIHFPLRDEKTTAEDFTKTMGLRDNNKTSHNITRDEVQRHHNIINSDQMYWSSDHSQENRYNLK
jgi:hypothetical protein